MTSSKNDPNVFCSTLHGVSNAVYRFSMRCVVLEILRGGGLKSPPAGSRLAPLITFPTFCPKILSNIEDIDV